ncbi:unnamed protein product [Closterium sp. Yama58-4]|nr:unnamed protein product [Closterium sp. Yama58-4]
MCTVSAHSETFFALPSSSTRPRLHHRNRSSTDAFIGARLISSCSSTLLLLTHAPFPSPRPFVLSWHNVFSHPVLLFSAIFIDRVIYCHCVRPHHQFRRAQQGEVWIGEFLVRRRDGSPFPAMRSSTALWRSDTRQPTRAADHLDVSKIEAGELEMGTANLASPRASRTASSCSRCPPYLECRWRLCSAQCARSPSTASSPSPANLASSGFCSSTNTGNETMGSIGGGSDGGNGGASGEAAMGGIGSIGGGSNRGNGGTSGEAATGGMGQ